MNFKQIKALSPEAVVASIVTSVAIALFFAAIQGYLSLDRAKLRFDLLSKVSTYQSQTLATSLHSAHKKLASFKEETTSLHQDLELFRDKIAQLDTALDVKGSLFTDKKNWSIRRAIGGAEVRCKGDECDAPELMSIDFSHLGDSLVKQLAGRVELLGGLPLSLPVRGSVSSVFGMRRSPFTGNWKHHQGLDFKVPYRTRLHATGNGTVLKVDRNSTYGLYVDIRHSDTIVSRYAHLARALVFEGQKVERNGAIALSGSSGRSTGPHLHYEVRVNGKAVDPVPYFMLGMRLRELS